MIHYENQAVRLGNLSDVITQVKPFEVCKQITKLDLVLIKG